MTLQSQPRFLSSAPHSSLPCQALTTARQRQALLLSIHRNPAKASAWEQQRKNRACRSGTAPIDRKTLLCAVAKAQNQRRKIRANPEPSLTLSTPSACSSMKRRLGKHLEMLLHSKSQLLLSALLCPLQHQEPKLAPFRPGKVSAWPSMQPRPLSSQLIQGWVFPCGIGEQSGGRGQGVRFKSCEQQPQHGFKAAYKEV